MSVSVWLRQAASFSPHRPADGRCRIPKGIDDLEAFFLGLLAVIVFIGWLAFTLAEFGLYSPGRLLGLAGVVLLGAAGTVLRSRRQPVRFQEVVAFLIPLVAGAALFFPPDEWILGALDPGSYVNAGAAIAKSGRIILSDPLLASIDPTLRQALFPFPASRLPGFYLTIPRFAGVVPGEFIVATDQVIPHGFHLFPVVLSLGYALGGVSSELLVTPLLALFALAGFWLLARRLFGLSTATIGGFLLAFGPGEIWFARYPAAEILGQVLLFGGLFAFVVMLDHPSRWAAALAGASFGSVHLAKIETLPLPFLLGGFLAYHAIVGSLDRRWLFLLVTYLPISAQAVVHAVYVSSWYTMTSFEKSLDQRLLIIAGFGLITGGIAALAIWRSRRVRALIRQVILASGWEMAVGLVLPALIGLVALYAYYVRPLGISLPPTNPLDIGQWLPVNDAEALPRLGWYISPLGVLLGCLGWILFVRRERDLRAILPLLIMGVDVLMYLDHTRIVPFHYWAARRWVMLVIPSFALAAAYTLVALLPQPPRIREGARLDSLEGDLADRSPRADSSVSDQKSSLDPLSAQGIIPFALGIVLVASLFTLNRPLRGYVEYRGAEQQLQHLADTIPADGVIFFPDGDAGQRFSVPLQYLYDRTSFVIANDPRQMEAAGQLARQFLQTQRPAYWITTTDRPDPSQIGLNGTIVGKQRVSLPEKIGTYSVPPGADGVFQQDLIIWKLAADPDHSQTGQRSPNTSR